MFGHDRILGKIQDERDYRKSDIRFLQEQISLLNKKINALEDFLDIEFKVYSASGRYIKATIVTKL